MALENMSIKEGMVESIPAAARIRDQDNGSADVLSTYTSRLSSVDPLTHAFVVANHSAIVFRAYLIENFGLDPQEEDLRDSAEDATYKCHVAHNAAATLANEIYTKNPEMHDEFVDAAESIASGLDMGLPQAIMYMWIKLATEIRDYQ